MNKKLTLNIDNSLIEFAHLYSKETQQSISALFEKYIKGLQKQTQDTEFSAVTQQLYGILEGQKVPDKHEMRKAFHEKSFN